MVTSSFRKGSGGSQHYKGQAADMQFSGVKNKEYKDIAQWIKNNIEYDQLLLEYKNNRSKRAWIHISYKKDVPIRKDVKTFLNDTAKLPNGTYGSGLINLAGQYGIPPDLV